MLVHTDHLQAGMRLEKDIELRAGSYLITRKELGDGCLNEKVIESVRKFAAQIVPFDHRVSISDDLFTLRYLRSTVDDDLTRVAAGIAAGKEYPNFLGDPDLEERVMRVMEAVLSNPDMIRLMYDSRFNSDANATPAALVIDHCFRTTLLAIALAVKLGSTMLSMTSLGMAAIIHDLSLLNSPYFDGSRSLDDLSPEELESFVDRHQVQSALLFSEHETSLSPYQRGEVMLALANHHRPPTGKMTHNNTMILHLADLLDEMVSHLPHKVRYSFSPKQVATLGRRYRLRTGMLNVLSALHGMSDDSGIQMRRMVTALAELLDLREALVEGYAEKLKEILAACPFKSAAAWPEPDGNLPPRTIYCSRSLEAGFQCEHMLFNRIEIQMQDGELETFRKCGALGRQLEELHENNR